MQISEPVAKDNSPKLRIIEIAVEGKKLPDMDGARNKSDTKVTLFMKWKQNQNDWHKVDQTEVIYDNLNPRYAKRFSVVYNLG